MSKNVGSFQENIRKTFIRFSIAPVAAIVMAVFVLFAIVWINFMEDSNKSDNAASCNEIKRIMNIYYEMMDDVSDILLPETNDNNSLEIIKDSADAAKVTLPVDEIFSALYNRTAPFGDIGNLIILSGDRKVLFSSKKNTPKFLIAEEYANWGVWKSIKTNEGKTATVLYGKNLCIGKGVYEGNTLKYAICYIVPNEVISGAIVVQDRFVILTDNSGWVYASNTKMMQDAYGQIDSSFYNKTGYVRQAGKLYYVFSNKTDKGLVLYTINDISRSIELIWVMVAIVIIIFIAIALITIRSTSKSSKEYTKDIKKIEDAFEEVQNGNFDVSLDIDSSTEFMVIGNDFNKMLQGLKDQIEQNKELAENAAFSQVKQLESQFNPHFLFNTLDNIRFMAKIDAAAADKMIVSLSGLLRYSIREVREEVTVKEDLDNLQYYLNILQIRFNKRFAYELDVAEDIMECLIPKLLIQPLLENAVKYGFGTKEKLCVSIRGYQMQEMLVFICEDDGAGIEEKQLKEIRDNLKEDSNTTMHYGLYNIHRRIRLMYKGDYGLDISSVKDKGTIVRLTIPKHI